MTAPADRTTAAAQWLADQACNPVPVLPALQAKFDLTHDQALEAIALAGKMRLLREAFA